MTDESGPQLMTVLPFTTWTPAPLAVELSLNGSVFDWLAGLVTSVNVVRTLTMVPESPPEQAREILNGLSGDGLPTPEKLLIATLPDGAWIEGVDTVQVGFCTTTIGIQELAPDLLMYVVRSILPALSVSFVAATFELLDSPGFGGGSNS